MADSPSSAYWLIVKNDDGPGEVLTIDLDGQEALPIFSFREEAEMFVWLEAGSTWSARETSVRELASLLFGLYLPYVKKVALDPLPEICDEGMVHLLSVSRNDFARTLAQEFLGGRGIKGSSTSARRPIDLRAHEKKASITACPVGTCAGSRNIGPGARGRSSGMGHLFSGC